MRRAVIKLVMTFYGLVYMIIALPFLVAGFLWCFIKDAFVTGIFLWDRLQENEDALVKYLDDETKKD